MMILWFFAVLLLVCFGIKILFVIFLLFGMIKLKFFVFVYVFMMWFMFFFRIWMIVFFCFDLFDWELSCIMMILLFMVVFSLFGGINMLFNEVFFGSRNVKFLVCVEIFFFIKFIFFGSL